VLPDKAKKNTFIWTASSEAAQHELLGEFESGTLTERLERARAYMKREGTVREGVLKSLADELLAIASQQSPEALETHLFLEEFDALPSPAPLAIDDVLAGHGAAEVVAGVRERRYREKLYRRLRKVRGDDWPQVFRDLFFFESDFRLMSQLYETLLEHGPERSAEKLVAEGVSNPRRTPRAFVWVTKNVVARDELRHRATHSLLSKIIDALDSDEFRDLKTHLREHFEAGGIAFLVFEGSDRDAVDHLLNLVDSAAALEDHRKTEIRRAIFRKYPDIRKRTDDDVLFVTAEAAEFRRNEFEQLVKVEIPANAEAIRVAREYGDLRENFEYHAARQKHELLNSRAAQLHADLQKIRLIDPTAVDAARVAIGTSFELQPVGGGPVRPVTILGHWDSDPDRGVYSYQSDFAKRLLGRAPGEIVETDAGDYRVGPVRPWRTPEHEVSQTVGAERESAGE
jgi:transcription elongation GreA/GreB family factor